MVTSHLDEWHDCKDRRNIRWVWVMVIMVSHDRSEVCVCMCVSLCLLPSYLHEFISVASQPWPIPRDRELTGATVQRATTTDVVVVTSIGTISSIGLVCSCLYHDLPLPLPLRYHPFPQICGLHPYLYIPIPFRFKNQATSFLLPSSLASSPSFGAENRHRRRFRLRRQATTLDPRPRQRTYRRKRPRRRLKTSTSSFIVHKQDATNRSSYQTVSFRSLSRTPRRKIGVISIIDQDSR